MVWVGAMVIVMGTVPVHPPPASASGEVNGDVQSDEGVLQPKRTSIAGVTASLRGMKDDNEKEPSDSTSVNNSTDEQDDRENTAPEEGAEVFQSILKNPTDFKFNTPIAPSCDIPVDTHDLAFTLVTQLSNDRLWMIPYHCKRWGEHPISIAVFSNRQADDVKEQLVKEGCNAEYLNVQTVSKTKYDPTGTEYPVNILRNLALSAVKTTHVVYADVDFWPASNLHSILTEQNVKERMASDNKLATVIPAFQMNRRCKEWRDCRDKNIPFMPENKSALLTLVSKKQASSFDPTNQGGHGSTKYITWRDQEAGTFKDLPCIKSNRYEPYLAFRYCSDLPPFQAGFTGYGKNKMTVSCESVLTGAMSFYAVAHLSSLQCLVVKWAMQLRRTGYLFSQLGGAFFVHYPHLDSKAREEWNKKPELLQKHGSVGAIPGEDKEQIDWGSFKRARVDALFLDFRDWLDEEVKDESRLPMCANAQNDDQRLWVQPPNNSASSRK